MKAKLKQATPTWQPVEVSLTFDKREELVAFHSLMRHNLTVPEHLVEEDIVSQGTGEIMTKVMNEVAGCIGSHSY